MLRILTALDRKGGDSTMAAPGNDAKRRREQARKRRDLINGIIEFLTPTINGMRAWEIRGLLNEVLSTIELKFHPFRTFGQAIEYRKGK
jgi:hypothetical protein